jgi:hypothetical protein
MEGQTKDECSGRFIPHPLYNHPAFLLDIINCERCQAPFAVGIQDSLIGSRNSLIGAQDSLIELKNSLIEEICR